MNKYFACIIILLASCKSQEVPDASLVVEAYIFANNPVENIKLSLVNPFNKNEISATSVSNAKVYIVWNDIFYTLTETDSVGIYTSFNSDLKIIHGESYGLFIEYNDEIYEALTTVPSPPKLLQADKDTLNINSSSDFINISWENLDSLWYLGIINEDNTKPTKLPFNNLLSIPTKSQNLDIKPNNVQSAGNMQFILYGVTDEYEDLYQITNSTVVPANAGNLSNGFGIFAAFSSDTLDIIVVEK